MLWGTAIEEWKAWLIAAGRPATTIKLRSYQITRFAVEHEDPWSQTQTTLVAWLAAQRWSNESRRS